MSNKQNNHIVDVNKKISSVEWLIEQFRNTIGDSIIKVMEDEIAQSKSMHKEEVVDFTFNYFLNNQNGEDIEQYYKETYGND